MQFAGREFGEQRPPSPTKHAEMMAHAHYHQVLTNHNFE